MSPIMELILLTMVLVHGVFFQTVKGNFAGLLSTTGDDDVPLRHGAPSDKIFEPERDDDSDTSAAERLHRPSVCTRKVEKCVAIPTNVTSYLATIAVTLDYNFMVDTPESDIFKMLHVIPGLSYHERCWTVAQPILYALALPKCSNVSGDGRLIPVDQCLAVQLACGSLVMNSLPSALTMLRTCDNWTILTNISTCERETSWFDDLESNIPFTCPFPLKATKDPIKQTFDNGVCGLQCQDPFLDENLRKDIHIYVSVLVSLSVLLNGTAFILLIRKWRSLAQYPDQCILFVNVCFIVSDIGWIIQFVPGARMILSCAEDGTERLNEPRNGEAYGLCLVTFILIYYFMMSAGLWFVVIAYCWHRSFRGLCSSEGKVKPFQRRHAVGFHIFAWVTPLIMTLIVVATSGIDGNNTTGVCFIGIRWILSRVFLLLVPLISVALVSCFFMAKGLLLLYKLQTHQSNSLSESDKNNIRSTMLHIGFIAVVVCICIFTSVFIHVHYYINQSDYAKQRIAFIECNLANAVHGATITPCVQKAEMDYETIELVIHVGLQFAAGIIFSSWVWRQRHSRLSHWLNNVKRKMRKISTAVNIKKSATAASIPMDTFSSGAVNHAFTDSVIETSPSDEIVFQISVENSNDNLTELESYYKTLDDSALARDTDYDIEFQSKRLDELSNGNTRTADRWLRKISVHTPASIDGSLSGELSIDADGDTSRENRPSVVELGRHKNASDTSISRTSSRDDSLTGVMSGETIPGAASVDEFTHHRYPLENWQDRARDIRSDRRKKVSTGSYYMPSRDDTKTNSNLRVRLSVVDGPGDIAENRLENWQDRAREIRTERRKKSSVTSYSTPVTRNSSTNRFTEQDESVHVIRDPSPTPVTKRQRRPGRVEFFKQSSSRSAMSSPVRSISQVEPIPVFDFVQLEPRIDSARSQLPPKSSRKISRIRMRPQGSQMEQTATAKASSPDEGIELERDNRDLLPLPAVVMDHTDQDEVAEIGRDVSNA